ncbi:hypothetical protein GCM10017559_07970 [Streptosporangium longisporum]|uniref:Uncharacterized protein n=1 Tax=Streptosporangium longisporum TaxID=46187 RepID=A0ABN3XRI0_9ACTN
MTNLILATLALAGIGLDLTRQLLIAVGELAPDPDVEAALHAHRALADQLPVRDSLEHIQARTTSRRWKPWR